jgi:uncharacterized protein
MSNLGKVQAIYAAFGRGDVPAILEALSPDVEWEYGGTPEVPWLQSRRGREGAGAFFRVLMELVELPSFEVKQLLEGQNGLVVAVIDAELKVKPTGRSFKEVDEIHLWHFDAHGRIAKFRHRADTLRHAAAYMS